MQIDMNLQNNGKKMRTKMFIIIIILNLIFSLIYQLNQCEIFPFVKY